MILGLSLQVLWYLLQMAVVAQMSPMRFLGGSLDVMASTISTSSTAATIPITLKSLERLGISRRSSQLTACIGTNFNNDGTALYMATAVLFMAQALGFELEHPRPDLDHAHDAGRQRRCRRHPFGELRHHAADLRRRPPARRKDPDPAHSRLAARPLPDHVERARRHDRGRSARPRFAAGRSPRRRTPAGGGRLVD